MDTIRTTLITGASAGIGEAFARELAAKGDRLILTARREDRLNTLAAELRATHNIECVTIPADLGVAGGAEKLFAETERLGLTVDLLINNAGFGKYGKFENYSVDIYQQMIQLNITSLVTLSHLYIAGMRARKQGGIINVASTAGFPPTPGFTVYGATKAFVVSFSQALAVEAARDAVRVCVLCPGATVSEFQQVAQTGTGTANTPGWQSAQTVARNGLRGYEAGKVIVISGLLNKLSTLAVGLLPRSFVRQMAGRISGM